jgi:hypothetical protein
LAQQCKEQLAKAARNPLANLISSPFQNNTNFNVGPRDDAQNVLNLQPEMVRARLPSVGRAVPRLRSLGNRARHLPALAIIFDEGLGAFAGYIHLGILWSNLCAMIELLARDSFSVSADIRWPLQDGHLRRALLNSSSQATTASLGYSDPIAIAPVANTLTWLEVMAARFLLAVVIAQIVGLTIARSIGMGRHDRA